MPEQTQKTIKRKFEGVVVSARGNKTLVVEVKTAKLHPKYLKRYAVSKKYKVHDEKNEFQAGDRTVFIECRPLSRSKRWRVLDKLRRDKKA